MKKMILDTTELSDLIGNLLDRSGFLEDLLFIRKDLSPDTRGVLLHTANESSQFAFDLEELLARWGGNQKNQTAAKGTDQPKWNPSDADQKGVLELVWRRDMELMTAYKNVMKIERWPDNIKEALTNQYHALRTSDEILHRLESGQLSSGLG